MAAARCEHRALLVVGVMGARAAGKSFAAEHLRRTRGATVLGFADPLKDAVIALFGFTEAQVYGDAAAKERVDATWGVSPRQVLAAFGTELLRDALPRQLPAAASLLVRRMEQRVAAVAQQQQAAAAGGPVAVVVIPDVRFDDEVAMVQRMGGVLWRVERVVGDAAPPPRWTGSQVDDARHAQHASERLASDTSQDLRRGVVRLANDGTPAGFGAVVDRAAAMALSEPPFGVPPRQSDDEP